MFIKPNPYLSATQQIINQINIILLIIAKAYIRVFKMLL
jgi:hypothetical protein